jgi:hypothetical protein
VSVALAYVAGKDADSFSKLKFTFLRRRSTTHTKKKREKKIYKTNPGGQLNEK